MAQAPDWFDTPRWDAAEQQRFRARLARSSDWHQPHYLCSKAAALAATGRPADVRAAIALLRECVARWPDSLQLTTARHQLGACYRSLGDADSALREFRACLRRERRVPNVRSPAWIDFVRLVVERGLDDRFGEALSILRRVEAARSDDTPDAKFVLHAARAVIRCRRGELAAAHRDAEAALEMAERASSWWAKHPKLGLVSPNDALLRRVRAIASDRRARERRAATRAPAPRSAMQRLILRLRSEFGIKAVEDDLEAAMRWPEPVLPLLVETLAGLPRTPDNEALRFGLVASLRDPRTRRVPGAAEVLIREYESSPDDSTAMALHPLLRTQHLPWLRRALARRDDGHVRDPLLSALVRLDRASALGPAVALATERRGSYPAIGAIAMVGRLGDRSCVRRLKPLLKHPFENVRRAAAAAIAAVRRR